MPEGQRDNAPDQPVPAHAADPPGIDLPSSFGKYFLTEKLATGGMAEIYLAKIVGPGGFEKPLVIKQIHPKLTGQRHFVDLFVAEAKTLVSLAHGNIVPVYELGVIDDTYFIAMEYIDGPTLYRLTETLRRRGVRMEPPLAAWITARILEGLDYAHRKSDGVIHRDLSPRNVMLSRDGEVKLVDFGIAVTLGTAGDDAAGESAPTGSFPYMSPEQVRKQPLTPQTDLFSVGVLFWEMLVGRRLFARDDPDATLAAVVAGEIPRPSAVSPGVPVKLDDVVMRALERDVAARWPSASDMLAALQRYLYSLDEPPGPRDVAAMVGRYCPPETRRLPTHHDPDAVEPEGTQPRGADGDRPLSIDEQRPGPRTTVLPRDGSPRGKRRARTETFATHVDLEQILERAAAPDARTEPGDASPAPSDFAITIRPSAAVPRDGDSPGERADATPPSPHNAPAARAASEHSDATPPRPRARRSSAPPISQPPPAGPPLVQLPGRAPPSRSLLVLAGLGATGLAVASVYVFLKGRDAMEYREAMIASDASIKTGLGEPGAPAISDAAVPDAVASPIDAARSTERNSGSGDPVAPADAAPPDHASSPPDHASSPPRPTLPARPAGPRGTGVRPPRPDARSPGDPPPALDPAAARPTGTATLTIGANPWGNVLLDGKRIGRTPIEHLSVPAGRHTIDVVFAGEDPPRTLKYTVDLTSGETRDVLADFTKP